VLVTQERKISAGWSWYAPIIGFRRQTHLWIKLARAAQELTVPFIASGGIGEGRGIAAALALGAVVSCACAGVGDWLANVISRAAHRALTWVRAMLGVNNTMFSDA